MTAKGSPIRGSPRCSTIKLYGRKYSLFEQILPPPIVAEELLLYPSTLEDTYARTSEHVERVVAQKAAIPEREFGFDELVDFLWAGETYLDKVTIAGRAAEERRREERYRRARLRKAEAARRREAWRAPPTPPTPPSYAPPPPPEPPRVHLTAWSLSSGVIVTVPRPRARNWPGSGDPDPTGFREEQRLRDFADAVELGPILGLTGTDEEAREIADGIAGLRELADVIRTKRERNG